MNINALFSGETGEYRIPMEPQKDSKVKIRFRTAKDDVDTVCMMVRQDKGYDAVSMKKIWSDNTFDFYEIELAVTDQQVKYHFSIERGTERVCFNKLGVVDEGWSWFDFRITPGFTTPDWAKGAVFYQIYVDRFYNGDKSNDVVDDEYIYINGQMVKQVRNWDEYPSSLDVFCFYGGDLKGVWDKLDYIQSLGVEVIYFNPLFVSPSNHKYDTQDYDYVDPHFGVIVKDCDLPEGKISSNAEALKYITRVSAKENLEASNEFFIKLVEEIHKRGMKVVLDGVFNHCGSFNKWMDREGIYEKEEGYASGAYVDEHSPYHDYFHFHGGQWPYNHSYDGWWGMDTLPKLNYEGSDELCQYILDVGRKWVSPPYNADGWRLDVAADLGHGEQFNHQFWKEFRRVVKEANPNAIILAEHYGDPSSWLAGDEWDTVMNYDAFMEPVTWFLTGMEKHSDVYHEFMRGNAAAFFDSMLKNMSKFHIQSLLTAMNELSNHDHSRFLTRTNRTVGRTASLGPEAAEQNIDKGVFREAVVMLMTWPGAPTLYYGDEAGLCGWTDPDNRRGYPWGKEDLELIEFHRYMIGIHRHNPALKVGALKPLVSEYQLISYGRFIGNNRVAVVINNDDKPRQVRVPVWEIGITGDSTILRIMLTNREGYNIGRMPYQVENGFLTFEMEPVSSVVFRTYHTDEI